MRLQGLGRKVARVGRHKAQVPAGQLRQRPPGHGGHHGRHARGLQRLGQQDPVAHGAAVVGDDPGHPHLSLEGGKALDHGGEASRHAVDVGHEDHGGLEPGGDLGRASLEAVGRGPVEETHDAFDDGDVGIGRGARNELLHVIASHHPAVEVVAGPSRGDGKVRGVEEVGPHLEGLYPRAPAAKGRHEGKGDRRLSGAAFRSSDDNPWAVDHVCITCLRDVAAPVF